MLWLRFGFQLLAKTKPQVPLLLVLFLMCLVQVKGACLGVMERAGRRDNVPTRGLCTPISGTKVESQCEFEPSPFQIEVRRVPVSEAGASILRCNCPWTVWRRDREDPGGRMICFTSPGPSQDLCLEQKPEAWHVRNLVTIEECPVVAVLPPILVKESKRSTCTI
jgi:hypothetical protein